MPVWCLCCTHDFYCQKIKFSHSILSFWRYCRRQRIACYHICSFILLLKMTNMTKPTRKTQGGKQHPGTRKVGKIVKNAWSEDKLMGALHILDSTPSVSIWGVAKQCNLSEATLRFRRKKNPSWRARFEKGW